MRQVHGARRPKQTCGFRPPEGRATYLYILEMNGDSYRLAEIRARKAP